MPEPVDVLRGLTGNGSCSFASLYTQKGHKNVNQDAMIVCENFISREDTVFCGVFDGHGSNGHFVSQSVRDILPVLLAQELQKCYEQESPTVRYIEKEHASLLHNNEAAVPRGDRELHDLYNECAGSFVRAFAAMDNILRKKESNYHASGTTAVVVVKKGSELIVGNLGDSRAVLATKDVHGGLVAKPLTTDLIPTVPREAERIKQRGGRIFSLSWDPQTARMWLPQKDIPGLAMSRSFGDLCLKDYGLICEPELSYLRLTENDQFIVLASDGVWNMLSNAEVVKLVASSPRDVAARRVVETAVRAWRDSFLDDRADDCTVVCIFWDNEIAKSYWNKRNTRGMVDVDCQ